MYDKELLNNKLKTLREYLHSLGSLAIAFSSGVDSTFLLKVAHEELGDKAIAVTATSCSFPKRESDEAAAFCKSNGIKQISIVSEELNIPEFRHNPPNRCYLCKKELFTKIISIAKENGIEIPKPVILEEKLTAEQSQEREDYWKKHYTEKGLKCLNKAITGVGKGSLGATIKWTYEEFCNEALKYSYKTEMKYKNQSAYKAGVHNGWIDIPFENRKKKDKYWDDIDNVLNAAKECTGAKDMVRRYGGAYNSARRHGWVDQLKYNNPGH